MEATKENARKMAAALKPQVETVLLATAHAECERERVDKIQRRVLAQLGYSQIEPKYDYHLPDEVAAEYFKRLNAIHLADGFERAADGHCPALTAEGLQTEAEQSLIDAATEFFPNCTTNALLCTAPGLETRQKYLDLLIGLVVNAPE